MNRPVNTHLTEASGSNAACMPRVKTAAAALLISLSAVTSSCGNNSDSERESNIAAETENPDDFHADNDIAMTVRSIADAISVGEPLDTAEYNYEGILTDGQGAPIYTDIQGAPGQWSVYVSSPTNAVIRNLYLGDLLPDDLRMYITSELNLTDKDIIESDEFDDDDESELIIYRISGGYLRFESRAGIAPNGLEGPLLSIVVTTAG